MRALVSVQLHSDGNLRVPMERAFQRPPDPNHPAYPILDKQRVLLQMKNSADKMIPWTLVVKVACEVFQCVACSLRSGLLCILLDFVAVDYHIFSFSF